MNMQRKFKSWYEGLRRFEVLYRVGAYYYRRLRLPSLAAAVAQRADEDKFFVHLVWKEGNVEFGVYVSQVGPTAEATVTVYRRFLDQEDEHLCLSRFLKPGDVYYE